MFYAKVPLLPEHCDIIIMRRTGVDMETNDMIYQDFRVQRAVIQQWLEYLETIHPTFLAQAVTVDYNLLEQLPEDSSVYARLRTIETQDIEELAEPVGPPETGNDPNANAEDAQQTPLFSRGFVPNLQTPHTELEQLHAAAFHNDQPIILTMPIIRGTPINEYEQQAIAINAFPSLFPTGQADFTATCDIEVSMEEWAAHLIRLKGGRFAQHPRFRCWALNTVMRKTAKKASNWYLNTHKDDKQLTVEDIREMIDSDDGIGLAQRVSHAGERLPGSKPFWQKAQHDLIAQIRSPECGSPHVFVTASSTDVQWPDMHCHMPDHDPTAPEDAHSYRICMTNLNNNPAIASYYFQK